MGYGNSSGFVPPLGGGGGGGSVTWADGEIGYGIDGDVVVSNSDFTYSLSGRGAGFNVGFSGENFFSLTTLGALTIPVLSFSVGGPLGGNGTAITVEDVEETVTIDTVNAYIGTESNFNNETTGMFSLGTLVDIPTLISSLGVYNTIANSGTGDVSIAGVGDFSGISGGSTMSAALAYFGGDNSQAYIYADNALPGIKIVSNVADAAGTHHMTSVQSATSWSIIGGANGTGISVNDSGSLITLTNVPAYINDAAAVAAGLATGDLYKSTVAGSTFLKILP